MKLVSIGKVRGCTAHLEKTLHQDAAIPTCGLASPAGEADWALAVARVPCRAEPAGPTVLTRDRPRADLRLVNYSGQTKM